MWSMISQDFSDFAEAVKSESAGLMGYLGTIAYDVAGRNGVYAGDEVLGKVVEDMPLPNGLLHRLQASEKTYTLPIQHSEAAPFAAWTVANPLSSRNSSARLQRAADGAATPATETHDALPSTSFHTPNRRSVDYPDEPADEARQRLLDCNEVVLEHYMALVGRAVSPRASRVASPASVQGQAPCMDRQWEGRSAQEASSQPATTATKERTPPLPTPPSSQTPVRGHISEDEFFDRYFFRLTQLRESESQRRGDAVAATTTTEMAATTTNPRVETPLPTMLSPTTAILAPSLSPLPPPSSSTTRVETQRDEADEDDEFAAVPLFAKRVMTAASGLVTGIDNALNSVVAGESSRYSRAGGKGRRGNSDNDDDEDDRANVDPRELIAYCGKEQQVKHLEEVVQELQEALRRECRRVQQLTAVLEEHHIEVPPECGTVPPSSAAGTTPARQSESTAEVVSHSNTLPADPSASIPSVGVPMEGVAITQTNLSATAMKSLTPMTTSATAAVTSVLSHAELIPSSGQSTSEELVSAAAEEDDNTWVHMGASAS